MVAFLVQHAPLSAYLAGGAWIAGSIALIVFFAGVSVFGPINDAFSVFQFLFLIPVALALHQILGRHAPVLSLGTAMGGIAAMLAVAVLQALLVIGRVSFEQTLKTILALTAVVGVWWLATSTVSLVHGALPAGLAWVGIVAGVASLVGMVGFWFWGYQHPLAVVGMLGVIVSAPVWAFWMAQTLALAAVP
jgi:hypothetical protein